MINHSTSQYTIIIQLSAKTVHTDVFRLPSSVFLTHPSVGILDYIESGVSYLLINQRGRDAGLFTRQPIFSSITPTIAVTSTIPATAFPEPYTQDGESLFPPLSWTNLPQGTAELLLVVQDADVPIPYPALHGLYYAIPPAVTSVEEADFSGKEPKYAQKGIKVIRNVLGKTYTAPRPLLNHGPHRYFYQVIALKKALSSELSAKPSYNEVLKKIQKEDILGWGEWVGVSERRA